MQPPRFKTSPSMAPIDEAGEIRAAPAAAERRLAAVIGNARAQAMVRACLQRSGCSDPRTPDDLRRFAEALIDEGGLAEAVGRSVKIEALLRGACPVERMAPDETSGS